MMSEILKKRPVAQVEAEKAESGAKPAKRGRKRKEINYSEELVKPIVNGLIKDATKSKKKPKVALEQPSPTVELVKPIVNGLIKEATKPRKEPKKKKKTNDDDDEDFIVKPIVNGIIKDAINQAEVKKTKKPKVDKLKLSEDDLTRVFTYMKNQNRPYIVNDVFLNLQKSIPKTTLVRIMDQLATEAKLTKKMYAKSSIYCINQDLLPVPPTEQIAEAKETLKTKEEKLKELKQQLREQKKVKSERDAVVNLSEKLDKLKVEKARLTSATKSDKSTTGGFDVNLAIKLKTRCVKLLAQWRQRQTKTFEIVDAVMDQYPKSKSDFIDEVGLELDTETIPKL